MSPEAPASPESSASPGESTISPTSGPIAHQIGRVEAAGTKVIYLTFDDGPDPTWTPQILKVLANNNAQATFFALGESYDAYPEIVRQIRAAGHTIGNHTHGHSSLPSLTSEKVREELQTGPASKCFRPPYGAMSDDARAIVGELHQEVVLWNVDPSDWDKPGADAIEERILEGAKPGAIVLLHDGGGDRSQTVTALEKALPTLTKRGYTLRAMGC